jgi:hypothetical protein
VSKSISNIFPEKELVWDEESINTSKPGIVIEFVF